MIKSLATATFALALAFAAPACDKAKDLTKFKDQAMALVSQYAPQLKELTGKLGDLTGRIDKLPASIPGVDKLKALLGDNKAAVTKVQGLLDGFPGKVTGAKSQGDITKLAGDLTKQAGDEIAKITTNIVETEKQVVAAEAEVAKGAAAATMVAEFTKKLASGFEVKGAGTGIEAGVIAFIEDAAKPVDKDTWFNFDRLAFTTGSADLDMEKSKDQLTNINEILKAFPNVKIKVGGYTDNVGDEKANQALSQKRAEAVVKALADMGIAKDRLEAEGYGPMHPVCAANDTDECKAQNRRIAVRLTAK